MPTADQVRSVFSAYLAAWESGDREAFLDLFAEAAVQVDPYPSEPNVGRDAIGAFFDRTLAMAQLSFRVGRVIVGGDRGVFPLTVVSVLAGGAGTIEIDAYDIVEVGDDGRITALTAFVDYEGARQVG